MTPKERREKRRREAQEASQNSRNEQRIAVAEGQPKGISKRERDQNVIRYYTAKTYQSLIELNKYVIDANKKGIELGVVGELKINDLIQDLKSTTGYVPTSEDNLLRSI